MASSHFDKVVEQVRALPVADQGRLRELLDAWLEQSRGSASLEVENQIAQDLLAEGVLDHVPPPITDPAPYQDRKPIAVEGTPVSEILIAERR